MKMLKIYKQKTQEFEPRELYRMYSELEDFFNEDSFSKYDNWNENLEIILDFQDADGSFKLLDSYNVPSDARVDFCHMPTYICTAILMKAYITDSSKFTSKEEAALSKGLKMSCCRNLSGHGFESLQGQINALNIFMKAGLREFLDLYPDFCPKFSKMIENIKSAFQKMESEGNFFGCWGESYETEIRAINEYFSKRRVFVYGTLMRGETNNHYMQNSNFIVRTTIEGYQMYDVGWYPAIIKGNNRVPGELYEVPAEDMPLIDMLEGEGQLYAKKTIKITDINGNTSFAFVYVYLLDCSELEKIPSWNEYVWYVSYGSNMLKERFMCYIKGGSFENSRYHDPCSDASLPIAVKAVGIPYGMYFGNCSSSWEYGGVSFLDTSKKGDSLGVAYLITQEQFEYVASEENCGRYPGGGEWYEDIIDLGEMDGFKVKTITNCNPRDYNEPCQAYMDTLKKGIKENWPEMSDEEIDDYLCNCIR